MTEPVADPRAVSRMTEPAESAAALALDLVAADPGQAAVHARRALDLARADRNPAAKAMAYRALGLAARELGDLAAGLAALHQAVRVASLAGLDAAAAQARMSRAFVLLSQGRTSAALRDASASVASLRGLDRARALAQHGLILQRAGRLDEALGVYATALSGLRRHDDRLWEAKLRNNRAILHTYQGHLRRAKTDITLAEQLYAALDLPRAQAGAHWNLGFIEGRGGDIPAALTALDAVAETYRKADLPVAALLLDTGEVLLAAGLATEAGQVVGDAVAELSRLGHATDLAEAHLLLARAQLAAGAAAQASRTAIVARRSFARQQRPNWAAMALYVSIRASWASGERSGRLMRSARAAAARLEEAGWASAALDVRLLAARIAIDLGRLELARTQLRAAARARRSVHVDRRAQAWHALALLRQQSGDRRGARAAVSAGLDAAERHRALLGATELRMLVAGQVAELASLGVALAIADGAAPRVLRAAERHRAATLRMRPVLPPADDTHASLLAQLRMAAAETESAQLAGAPVQALSRRQQALEERLLRYLRHAPGDPGAPSPAGTDALAAALADRVLVEYVESAGELYAVVLSAGRYTLRALGPAAPVAADLESLRFACQRRLTGHGSAASLAAAAQLADRTAARLDAALLAPLAPALLSQPTSHPLVIVPSGKLQSLPWSMLPSCAARPVTVAPSAASWLTARSAAIATPATETAPTPGPTPAAGAARPAATATAGAAGRVVLVAGPDVPAAAAELDALAALYPGATVLAGHDATIGAVLAALDGAEVAHVAAHGRFRADNPLFSALVLADGPLTVYDLERLRRAPRTIMLAACDSGLSPVRPGDEMTGLAAALLAVGASTVVAPLLPLPDQVSEILARRWHQLVSAGSTPAAALAAVRTQNNSQHRSQDQGQADSQDGGAAAALVCLGYGG
jgi:CHAT domain-containing protein/tetratricopeptide (TPR) repeat protein